MIEFTVYGRPVPQGSMIAMKSKSTGKCIAIPSDPKGLRAWRKAVAAAAKEAWPHGPVEDPLQVDLIFYRNPPKTKAGDTWDVAGADGDKLTRAIWDGITKVITVNDNRVVRWTGQKLFTDDEERVEVSIRSLNRSLAS